MSREQDLLRRSPTLPSKGATLGTVNDRLERLERILFASGAGPMSWALYAAGGDGNDSIASGGENFFTFGAGGQLVGGTELFDYGAGTDQPKPLTDGMYSFSAAAQWDDAALGDARDFLTFELTGLDSLYGTTGFVQAKANFEMLDLYAPFPGGDTGAGHVAGVWPAWTSTAFRLGLLNNDSTNTHTVSNYQCAVIRLGNLPA